MTAAYPLQWPSCWPRTLAVTGSRFKTKFSAARDNLIRQLELINARNCVLSSNVELRLDGMPYANRSEPRDSGVAVYFTLDGKQICIPCDRYRLVCDNIHAIALTLEAMRGIDRWGTGKMMNAAFTGFVAIADRPHWRSILGVGPHDGLATAENAYRNLARTHHPDTPGGSHQRMAQINAAIADARKELQL